MQERLEKRSKRAFVHTQNEYSTRAKARRLNAAIHVVARLSNKEGAPAPKSFTSSVTKNCRKQFSYALTLVPKNSSMAVI